MPSFGVENIVVHANHDVFGTGLFDWSGDNYTLHTLVQVTLQNLDRLHFATGLNHQITA